MKKKKDIYDELVIQIRLLVFLGLVLGLLIGSCFYEKEEK